MTMKSRNGGFFPRNLMEPTGATLDSEGHGHIPRNFLCLYTRQQTHTPFPRQVPGKGGGQKDKENGDLGRLLKDA